MVECRFSFVQMLYSSDSRLVQVWIQCASSVNQSGFRSSPMFLNHWFNVGSSFMPNWFMVGSMVVLICLMFGSVLVPAWFIQLWLSFGSGLVQRCVHTLHICGSDGVLGSLLAQVVKRWVPFEIDVVRFGFRCVTLWVQLRFSVRSSLAWILTWSTFGACVLQTGFRCCSDLDLIGFIFDTTLRKCWFILGPLGTSLFRYWFTVLIVNRFKCGSELRGGG